MARRSTNSEPVPEPEITEEWLLKDRHVKVMTPTDKRHTFFVRLANDQVWEINPVQRPMKALLRAFRVDDFAFDQVWPDLWVESVCFEIEDYLKEILKFRHQKKIVDTKVIFGIKPFCQWWYSTVYSGIGQRQDIHLPGKIQCMNEGTTIEAFDDMDESGNMYHKREWRCDEHKDKRITHEFKDVQDLGMIGPVYSRLASEARTYFIFAPLALPELNINLSNIQDVKEGLKISQEELAKRKQQEADLSELMMIEAQITQQTNGGVVTKAEDKRKIHDMAKEVQRKNKRQRVAGASQGLTEDEILEADSAPMITKIVKGDIRDGSIKVPEFTPSIAGKEETLAKEKERTSVVTEAVADVEAEEEEEAEEETGEHSSSQRKRRRRS